MEGYKNIGFWSVARCMLCCFCMGVLFAFAGHAKGQDNIRHQYRLENWTVERGLPGNAVFTILQTRDGYLWFGTLSGLVRFDGIRFETFNTSNTEALKSNSIRILLEDRQGNLWIGTGDGLVKFKNGIFTDSTPPEIKKYSVLCLLEDAAGRIWIGTNGKGLFSKDKDTITCYSTDQGLSNPIVRDLYEDRAGNLLVSTDHGLNLIKDGKIRVFTYKDGLLSDIIGKICEDRDRGLWIATQKGLNRYKDGIFTTIPLPREYAGKAIFSLYMDRHGVLWMGVAGSGLLSLKDGIFTPVLAREESLKNLINTIYEDIEGSLWIATLDGGLNMLRPLKFTTISAAEGLSHDTVLCICEDHERSLWIGTYEGLNCWKTNHKAVFTKETGLSHNVITALYEDRHHNLWIGTLEGGLNCYNHHAFTVYTSRTHGLASNTIWSIHEGHRGNLWVGTAEGLNKFQYGRFITYNTDQGLSHNDVRFIIPDRKQNLWIGTYGGGLNLYKNGKFSVFNTRHGLANNMITFIHVDSENTLWIGTLKGLSRFKNSTFTSYYLENGLFNDRVYQVFEDEDKNLWIGSASGIFRVSKQELNDFAEGKINKIHSYFYNEKDGIKSTACVGGCQPAGFKSQDGKLWFSTLKGVTMVNPAQLKINTRVPPIAIEGFIVDGEQIHTYNNVESEQLVLSPGKKRFEFHYTALSFLNPRKIRFKYKLEGYDRDWIEAGNHRSTIYTGLSAGNYHFKVIACNDDGIWNEKGAALSFRLTPFFYQTAWFYIFVVLFGSLAVLFGYRLRVSQLKAREKELKTQVQLRTRDLQAAHDELKESKKIIEEKNQHIMDSIHYASKIQNTILRTNEQMKDVLTDYFVIFRPRDIVSGDFYWFSHVEDKYFIAVADCTGHGVPGALLSTIGIIELNDLVNKKHIFDPALILRHLHLDFRRILQQERAYTDTLDGMDMALCLIDMKKSKLTFAGAKRPLLMVTGKENQASIKKCFTGTKRHKCIPGDRFLLWQIKGDRKPIGGHQKEQARTFKNIDIIIYPGSSLYLLSDGLVHQGNAREEKFGYRRLERFLLAQAHLEMEEQKNALLESLKNFQGKEEQRDDITLLGIKLKTK